MGEFTWLSPIAAFALLLLAGCGGGNNTPASGSRTASVRRSPIVTAIQMADAQVTNPQMSTQSLRAAI